MALPSSGLISLGDILAEFNAPANTKLSQMVRGGVYVPNTAQNVGVPTAPPISVRDFLGASASSPLVVTVTPSNPLGMVFLAEPAPPNAFVATSCTVSATGGDGSYTFTWQFIAGDAMTFNTSGSPPGSSASWSATVGRNGQKQAQYRVTVNDGVQPAVVRTVNVTLMYETNI